MIQVVGREARVDDDARRIGQRPWRLHHRRQHQHDDRDSHDVRRSSRQRGTPPTQPRRQPATKPDRPNGKSERQHDHQQVQASAVADGVRAADRRGVSRIFQEWDQVDGAECRCCQHERQRPRAETREPRVCDDEGDGEQSPHRDGEGKDPEAHADVGLNPAGEHLHAVVVHPGDGRFGVAAALLVADGTAGDRFDEDPGEHECEHSSERAGEQAARDYALFHFSVTRGQWQGKPRRWRASWTNSWTWVSLPKMEVAP